MGLEWIDTWAGLAGFVAVLAWIGNQGRKTRRFMEHRFQAIEQRFDATDRRIDRVKAEIKESEQRTLAFVNKRLDDLNKRLDDFKDFVLTLISGMPRHRVSDASDSSSDQERRAEN